MISFSWFLWHWALINYVHIISFAGAPIWIMVGVGAAAFILAYLSWRYVEQPFRQMRSRPTKTLLSYATVLGVALVFTATIKYGQGLPQRLPAQASTVEATMQAGRGDCLANLAARSPDKTAACHIGKNGQPSVGPLRARPCA